MKSRTIKEQMVPISDYATVQKGATLFEALMALHLSQTEFDQTKYRHRAILVLNKDNQVIGKVSQHDVLKALEPKYMDVGKGAHFVFSSKFLKTLHQQFSLLESPMENICQKAGSMKVEDFMHTPGETEFINVEDSLDLAIHQLIMGHHQSLLVKKGNEVVGVLRLTDVVSRVFETMKQCDINSP